MSIALDKSDNSIFPLYTIWTDVETKNPVPNSRWDFIDSDCKKLLSKIDQERILNHTPDRDKTLDKEDVDYLRDAIHSLVERNKQEDIKKNNSDNPVDIGNVMQEIKKISDRVDTKLSQFETQLNDLNSTVNTLKQQQDIQGHDLEILTGIVDDIKANQNSEEIGFLKQLLEKDEHGKIPLKEYLETLKVQLSETKKFESNAEKIINHSLHNKTMNRDVFETAKINI